MGRIVSPQRVGYRAVVGVGERPSEAAQVGRNLGLGITRERRLEIGRSKLVPGVQMNAPGCGW